MFLPEFKTTLAAETHPREATSLAGGPLDAVNTFLQPWSTGAMVLGITILGICGVVVGTKIGIRSAGARKGESGHRESLGAVFGIALGGLVIGAALTLVALAVKIGQNAGSVS